MESSRKPLDVNEMGVHEPGIPKALRQILKPMCLEVYPKIEQNMKNEERELVIPREGITDY